MSRTHRPYPPEVRAEAVRLARRSEKTIPALAADLGVSSEALRHWLRQADADEGRGQPGELTTEERDEPRRWGDRLRLPARDTRAATPLSSTDSVAAMRPARPLGYSPPCRRTLAWRAPVSGRSRSQRRVERVTRSPESFSQLAPRPAGSGARLNIVIVTRNPVGTLLPTLRRLAALPGRHPIVVVDNDSNDGTRAAVRGSSRRARRSGSPRIGAASRATSACAPWTTRTSPSPTTIRGELPAASSGRAPSSTPPRAWG